MPILNVNPTRMELTNLKRKLITARRGHRLLKDKRDELMRRFLELIYENKRLRTETEAKIREANLAMETARCAMGDKALQVALMLPARETTLDTSEKNIMSITVPVFDYNAQSANRNDIYAYGFAETPGELDLAVKAFFEVMPKLLRLAEAETACRLMAAEIEKTRRRVNALEYVLIPRYEDTIRYITVKLDENERSTTARLMKIRKTMLTEKYNHKKPKAHFSSHG